MTAPELVEVVAAVLDTHVRIKSQTLHQECLCGWVGKVLGYDHPAHQARSVLDVLTEAGTVEWGNMAEGADRPFENFGPGKQAELAAKSFARVYGIPVVSRLALPWERAE